MGRRRGEGQGDGEVRMWGGREGRAGVGRGEDVGRKRGEGQG